jgi:hypothetical protein
VPTLLEAGTVCAWRAGLAHLRTGALEVCGRLPPGLARAALGLSSASDGDYLEELLQELRADPWVQPTSAGKPGTRSLRIVATVGAFRGFGGLFLRPPLVERAGDDLLVSDGDDHWVLAADVFGTTFRLASAVQVSDAEASPFSLDRQGRVTCAGEKRAFPELRGATSHAANATTLAVTVPLSHVVHLIARSSQP